MTANVQKYDSKNTKPVCPIDRWSLELMWDHTEIYLFFLFHNYCKISLNSSHSKSCYNLICISNLDDQVSKQNSVKWYKDDSFQH